MTPVLYNGFWISPDQRIGTWHIAGGTVTQEQKDNANAIKSFFVDHLGWTLNAVCAMLGNMMGESTLNPAFIQQTNRWRLPNSASSISDVPNSVMQNFYKEYYGVSNRAFGVGLVQWDGYTESAGVRRQKMVNYAIVNNINWYDGWTQLYRLKFEHDNDNTYHFFKQVRVGGIYYTFSNFVTSTASVSDLTKAWSWGYERNAGGADDRIPDAQYWWAYFNDPDAPLPITPLNPMPYDPDEPPFDPDDPVDPDEPIENLLALMLLCYRKRKELKPKCQRM